MYDVVVVGGGIGGLSVAALLQSEGRRVALVEAREYVGGCAATFRHGGRASEAGATWLTGLEPGLPLHRLFTLLDMKPERLGKREVDPMAIVFRERTVRRHADPDLWNEQLARAFGLDAPAFWQKVHLTARAQWERIERFHAFPPQTGSEWFAAATSLRGRDWNLGEGLVSTGLQSRRAGLEAITPLLDAQLMITTQGRVDEVPWLYGAPGLDFAAMPARHVPGGIGGVADAIARRFEALGGELYTGDPVERLRFREHHWRAVTEGGRRVEARHVVLNLTHGAAAALLEGEAQDYFGWKALRHHNPLGAFDVHFRQKDAFDPEGPRFFQIVLDEPLPFIGSTSFFVTVSPPGDPVLSSGGMRNVNISTHTPTDIWWKLEKSAYDEHKAALTKRLLEELERALPDLFAGAHEDVHSGTPVTFARFVGRSEGSVGGYPLTYRNLPWRVPGARTPLPGLWQVGDQVFPGQSIPGTALGAIYCVEKMLGGNL